MGLDRLSVVLVAAAALLAGCDSRDRGRPQRLLDGEPAQQFAPVENSVVTIGRVLEGTTLGGRFANCKPDDVPTDAIVVERIGVTGESLTFVSADGRTLYSCDGGSDAAHERKPPWCGGSAGRLASGKLLDPRLDILCRDRDGKPVAYAWLEPGGGARWIGVDQGSYIELYEVLGDLPVRISSARGIDLQDSHATFAVTQYDETGNALLTGNLEARVTG